MGSSGLKARGRRWALPAAPGKPSRPPVCGPIHFRASHRLCLAPASLSHSQGAQHRPAPRAVRPAGWQPDFIPFPANLTWSQLPEVRAWASLGDHGFCPPWPPSVPCPGEHLVLPQEDGFSPPTPPASAHSIGPLTGSGVTRPLRAPPGRASSLSRACPPVEVLGQELAV